MRSLVSVIVLGSMSKIVTGDLYVQGMSCQIKHVGVYKLPVYFTMIPLIFQQARILLDRILR